MKKVLFVGNRLHVLEECLARKSWDVRRILVLEGSPGARKLREAGIQHETFGTGERDALVEKLLAAEFDILVSNGCPFRLPISRLSRSGRIFLNTHPSLLPEVRGPHPINAVLLEGHDHYGATTHYMDDDLDTGNIVARIQKPITEDLDLGLLYHLAFELERETFRLAAERLEESGGTLEGEPQEGEGIFFRRKKSLRVADIRQESTATLLRRIRAFGIASQGVLLSIPAGELTVYEASEIRNPELLARFADRAPGDIVLEYDQKLLVRTLDGLIRISRFTGAGL